MFFVGKTMVDTETMSYGRLHFTVLCGPFGDRGIARLLKIKRSRFKILRNFFF